jgi:hypothetical protein
MPRAPHPARSLHARVLATAVLACAALGLASCGNDAKPTTPVVTPGAPGPMITLTGDPNVTFNLQCLINRAAGQDTMSGYYYVTLTDSVGRYAFVNSVTLNGVPMRQELNGGTAPFRYSLRPFDLGPSYRNSDVLHVAVTDTSGLTAPFDVNVEPSVLDLAPDGMALSRRNDLTVRWNGAPEQVSLTLTDIVGTRVSARLQFENETGVSSLLVRAQDLKGLALGTLRVGSSVTNSQSFVTATHQKRMTASAVVSDARTWQLVP